MRKEDSVQRRAAQTTIYKILSAISRLISPIIPFTAEEIWSYIPHTDDDNTISIALNDMPCKSGLEFSDEFKNKWTLISALREDAKKALEIKRVEKIIGASLEAKLEIICNTDEKYEEVKALSDELAKIIIVSHVSVLKGESGEFKGDLFGTDGISFNAKKADGEKCERCWMYTEDVGKNDKHPTLCGRCASVIG